MKKNKPKIIVICGPTASGKSDLAVWLAKKIKGEVISADSRQVYKGLDIGSGKITKKEMKGITHYLLDVENPKKIFSVSDYKILAEKAINEIIMKEKVPIICGGTGFYIDAVVKNLVLPEVPPNLKLRNSLSKKTTESLYKILCKLDSERARSMDRNNKVRIVRAIEIAKALGKVPKIQSSEIYRHLSIGINWPNEILQKRIRERLLKRIEVGMIEEVKNLHKNGLSWKRMHELGLEYRYISLYLQNKLSKEEIIEKLNTEICHYAKRQMTWFKRDKKIRWFGVKERGKILGKVERFLR